MATPIVLLSGPPASGKTTVGREIARLAPAGPRIPDGLDADDFRLG